VATKLRTGCRDVELRLLLVSDLDNPLRGWLRYDLHAKVTTYPHAFPLPDDVCAMLRKLAGKRPSSAPLFSLDGIRPLGAWTLRKRFHAASKAAGVVPPIESAGQLRAEVATAAIEALANLDDVARAMGWRSSETPRKHYWRVKEKREMERRRRVALAIAEALPLA
jgi:integrase